MIPDRHAGAGQRAGPLTEPKPPEPRRQGLPSGRRQKVRRLGSMRQLNCRIEGCALPLEITSSLS